MFPVNGATAGGATAGFPPPAIATQAAAASAATTATPVVNTSNELLQRVSEASSSALETVESLESTYQQFQATLSSMFQYEVQKTATGFELKKKCGDSKSDVNKSDANKSDASVKEKRSVESQERTFQSQIEKLEGLLKEIYIDCSQDPITLSYHHFSFLTLREYLTLNFRALFLVMIKKGTNRKNLPWASIRDILFRQEQTFKDLNWTAFQKVFDDFAKSLAISVDDQKVLKGYMMALYMLSTVEDRMDQPVSSRPIENHKVLGFTKALTHGLFLLMEKVVVKPRYQEMNIAEKLEEAGRDFKQCLTSFLGTNIRRNVPKGVKYQTPLNFRGIEPMISIMSHDLTFLSSYYTKRFSGLPEIIGNDAQFSQEALNTISFSLAVFEKRLVVFQKHLKAYLKFAVYFGDSFPTHRYSIVYSLGAFRNHSMLTSHQLDKFAEGIHAIGKECPKISIEKGSQFLCMSQIYSIICDCISTKKVKSIKQIQKEYPHLNALVPSLMKLCIQCLQKDSVEAGYRLLIEAKQECDEQLGENLVQLDPSQKEKMTVMRWSPIFQTCKEKILTEECQDAMASISSDFGDLCDKGEMVLSDVLRLVELHIQTFSKLRVNEIARGDETDPAFAEYMTAATETKKNLLYQIVRPDLAETILAFEERLTESVAKAACSVDQLLEAVRFMKEPLNMLQTCLDHMPPAAASTGEDEIEKGFHQFIAQLDLEEETEAQKALLKTIKEAVQVSEAEEKESKEIEAEEEPSSAAAAASVEKVEPKQAKSLSKATRPSPERAFYDTDESYGIALFISQLEQAYDIIDTQFPIRTFRNLPPDKIAKLQQIQSLYRMRLILQILPQCQKKKQKELLLKASFFSGRLALEQSLTSTLKFFVPNARLLHSVERMMKIIGIHPAIIQHWLDKKPHGTIDDRYPFCEKEKNDTENNIPLSHYLKQLVQLQKELLNLEENPSQMNVDWTQVSRSSQGNAPKSAEAAAGGAAAAETQDEVRTNHLSKDQRERLKETPSRLDVMQEQLASYLKKVPSSKVEGKIEALQNAQYHLECLKEWLDLFSEMPQQVPFLFVYRYFTQFHTQYFVENLGTYLSSKSDSEPVVWTHKLFRFKLTEEGSRADRILKKIDTGKAPEYGYKKNIGAMKILNEYYLRALLEIRDGEGSTVRIRSVRQKSDTELFRESFEFFEECEFLIKELLDSQLFKSSTK